MPFSVYIAKPPAGGGYAPNVYKVGKTTEEDVGSRVAALNDSGSNYPTANGENWDLIDHFSLASAEQMDGFENAMAEELGTGLDPLGTGATELFESAALEADVHDAAMAGIKTLVESGLLDVGTVASLAAEHGTDGAMAAASALQSATGDITAADAADLIAELVWELLPLAVPGLGIGLAVWRGKRIIGWMKGQWQQVHLQHWQTNTPRPVKPKDIAEGDDTFKRARAARQERQRNT